ncbi:peptide-methionine (R)-S-oxide reductase MsrB [Novosphingobium flavum]|uniref:peptide-methionine (R)-S-oxide reductase n=1 Tax=Novosphingobium aerophilum TaxID=2839843 RepID=A0A7X1KC68_9SPHN|nr:MULTISPECIES: peptide-methionine (R)-S-oxide reductase MsrB [Novosphingobium]MBC2651787.1 peptide-methionine (R)-S-oxide reductase MsrB [Novosphingobium aerophilum]MBC2662220.1 peptide-methionine (R)-S-oxide reductase MsrB [Novosphingobium aerophilum]
MTPDRRAFLMLLGGASALALAAPRIGSARSGADRPPRTWPLQLSEAEWRRRLTPEQFHILREAGTERPGTSPLLREHRRGTFVCAADGHALFASSTKFESGTGWPSFWRPLPGAVVKQSDRSLGIERTEVLCARCGGHLGHVFDDGPMPTGDRYCMNGVALRFVPG